MSHVDQLLEEYLRVINAKDDEIHELIRGVEEHRSELKRKEEIHKADFESTKQDLVKARKRIKRMQQIHEKDEENIKQLINHNEAMKIKIKDMQNQLDEVSNVIKTNQQEHFRVLKESQEQHNSEIKAILAERDELKAQQSNLIHKQEAAQKAIESCESKAQQLRAREVANDEIKDNLENMKREMLTMVPIQKLKDTQAECEKSVLLIKEKTAAEIDDLKVQLSKAKKAANKYRNELSELKTLHDQLQKKYIETSHKEEEVREQLIKELETSKKLSNSQQKEIDQYREMAEKTAIKLNTTIDELQRSETRIQDSEKRFKEILDTTEQEREHYRQEKENAYTQLNSLQSKITEQRHEFEVMQKRLETNTAEMKQYHSSLIATKEESLRCTAELKERLAVLTGERNRAKEDCEKLTFEIKDVQHQLSMLQERSEEEKKMFSSKISDANNTMERMREQIKDKEHQQQTLIAAQEKRIQEIMWAHKSELAECKKLLESELHELRQRLESTNAKLAEESANNKVYQREMQIANESLKNIREECERKINEKRELTRALEDAKREVLELRESLKRQEQLTETAGLNEARLRRSTEQLESERAADTKRFKSLENNLAEAKEELAAKRDETIELRRELKKFSDEGVKRESVELAAKLSESQGRTQRLEQEFIELQRERERLLISLEKQQQLKEAAEKAQRDVNEKLLCVNTELEKKSAECKRVSQHAQEVEDLAKKSCMDLERELARRDATIESLQQEATRITEERAKVALLEERLSHQAELGRRDVESLQERISMLEKELNTREAELQHHMTETESMAAQLHSLQEHAGELEEVVVQKEKKHALRKEALRKALEKVDAASDRKVEEEASREKGVESHKAEARRLQEQLQLVQQQLWTAETKLSAQETALSESRRLLSGNEDAMQQQITKADTLVRELAKSHEALRVAEEAKNEALQFSKDVQRRVAISYNRLITNFAEDAVVTKEMFGDFAIATVARTLQKLGKIMHDGCDTAASFKRQCDEELRQQQIKLRREIDELKCTHAAEMESTVDEKNKEISKMVLQHGADIAQLRQEIVDVNSRASHDLEAALKDYHRKEEQFHREKTELECAKLEIAHQGDQILALKEQIRVLEQRSEAERTFIDQEKRSLLHQQERIRRRIDDCTMEQNQSEVEVKELRSEILALQKILQEKEKALLGERERRREESRRLTTVTAAKETLHNQMEELRRQVQALQQQLSVARQGAQLTGNTAAAQQTRMEERIAELTRTLNALDLEKRRLDRQARNDERKISILEKELAESRKREADLSSQLQARKSENSALKERCANLESLKNISEVTLAETRIREKDLIEKMEEMRSAQQLMQLCFDKQQEQLEVGRRMHEQDVNRSGFFFKDGR